MTRARRARSADGTRVLRADGSREALQGCAWSGNVPPWIALRALAMTERRESRGDQPKAASAVVASDFGGAIGTSRRVTKIVLSPEDLSGSRRRGGRACARPPADRRPARAGC